MSKWLPTLFVIWMAAQPAAGQPLPVPADTVRIALLLDRGSHYLDRPAPHSPREDSAIQFLAKALRLSDSLQTDKWKDRTLVLLGTRYTRIGMLKQGKDYLMQVIGDYHKKGDKEQEAEAWLVLGTELPAKPEANIPEKLQALDSARLSFVKLGHPLRETDAALEVAKTHLEQGKLDLAQGELLQVLQQYNTLGYKKLHYTYDLLADVYASRNDEQQELVYRLQSVKSMDSTGDTLKAHYDYARLAVIYRDLNMWNESVRWISRSLASEKRQYEFGDFYGDMNLLIQDLIKLGRTGEALAFLQKNSQENPPAQLAQRVDLNEMYANCYADLRQYDKAGYYYQEMLRGFEITSFNDRYYSTHVQMVLDFIHYYEVVGVFYVNTKQYDKAKFYLNKILDLPPGSVPPISLMRIHHMQFIVDSASGNYISAIRQYEMHKKLSDSVFNGAKDKQIAELQIKYNSEKKDQSITTLQMKSQNQAAELQKVNMQRDITIAGIMGLIIITGLAYNGYRNKQRSNTALRIKQIEINEQNISLQHLLKEKEWLLKEVHHRVKNNLQIIISLLNTQTDFLDNPSALHAIQDSRERMQAIALIHQKLYQQDHSTLINMHSYIHELISYLISSFNNTGRIYFDLDIDEINLDVSQAVPLGLILNEAITNAVKYAFPKGGHGTISVLLNREGTRDVHLQIADNGVGFPRNIDLSGKTSLGIQLMKLFAEQLEGSIRLQSKHGVEISLHFRQQFGLV
jgi:two-component system, sensor histidine kinase PdtaS